MFYSKKPSNYKFIQDIRKRKDLQLKSCIYLKETTKLRYYQVVGCLHFLCLSRMILGDGVGLGKTISALSGYSFLLQKDPTLKLLVVAPKSATTQWEEEIQKFTKGISVHVLSNEYGRNKSTGEYNHIEYFREKKIKFERLSGFDARKIQYDTVKDNVLIISYSVLFNEYKYLIENRLPNYMVILDEIQTIKERKSQVHLGARKIADRASRVYGLSATLIKNRLAEAYNIFSVIVPGLFGGATKFNNEFTKQKIEMIHRGDKVLRIKKIVGYKNLTDFRDTIDPYFLIRRTQEVASELPKLFSKKIVLDMTEAQRKLYAEALSGDVYRRLTKKKYFEFREYMDNNTNPTDKEKERFELYQQQYDDSMKQDCMWKNKMANLTYCQMISNGPAWLEDDQKGDSSKEEEFRRLFDQELGMEKVIVFTRFKTGIIRLGAILDELEIKHVQITGAENDAERKEARLSFQDPTKDIPVIFITTAGSAALNLQAANVLLLYDTPWSYGDLYQTIGRAQRIGSLYDHIYVLHLVNRKSIDEHVLKILDSKKDLITDVMGDIAEGAIEFDKNKDKEILFKEDENVVNALFDKVFSEDNKNAV